MDPGLKLVELFSQLIVIENDKHRYDRHNFSQDRCTRVSKVMSLYDASFLRNYIQVFSWITTWDLSATIYIAYSQREIKSEGGGREGGREGRQVNCAKGIIGPGLHLTGR